jgi:hypothetical protein
MGPGGDHRRLPGDRDLQGPVRRLRQRHFRGPVTLHDGDEGAADGVEDPAAARSVADRGVHHARHPLQREAALLGGELTDDAADHREPAAPREGEDQDLVAEAHRRLQGRGRQLESLDLEDGEVDVVAAG